MQTAIGILFILALNFMVARRFRTKVILNGILMTVGSLFIFGFWSNAFGVESKKIYPFLNLLPLIFGSLIPLIVLFVVRANTKNSASEIIRNDDEHSESQPNQPEESKQTMFNIPKDWDDFFNNPKYSYGLMKLLLVILVIAGTILYNVISWLGRYF